MVLFFEFQRTLSAPKAPAIYTLVYIAGVETQLALLSSRLRYPLLNVQKPVIPHKYMV